MDIVVPTVGCTNRNSVVNSVMFGNSLKYLALHANLSEWLQRVVSVDVESEEIGHA